MSFQIHYSDFTSTDLINALVFCVREGHAGPAALLAAGGVNLEVRAPHFDPIIEKWLLLPPLLIAVLQGFDSTTVNLLENGASAKAFGFGLGGDETKITALHIALLRSAEKVAEILLQHGVEVDVLGYIPHNPTPWQPEPLIYNSGMPNNYHSEIL